MQQKEHRKLWKRAVSVGLSFALAAAFIPGVPTEAAELSEAASAPPALLKAGTVPVNDAVVTYDEPLAPNTGGSGTFRIPALITLENGDLLAAADARWGTTADGGGLDTIASVSSDGGKTWKPSYPLYFPDSRGLAGNKATTIIDPGIVEGPDGTIYCFADVNPTGSTTLFKTIGTGTGYVTVNNTVDQGRYLAITDVYDNVDTEPSDTNLNTYPYYVSDLNEEGYASIRQRADGSETGFAVDEWYNLYTVGDDGAYVDNLRQSQVNTTTQIQQNVYYKDSKYHVYSINYIWVITSKDHGRTWEHPRNINDQVKRKTGEHAILVSPGQGMTTSSGDIVIGFYDSQDGQENASIVYSTDNGVTWERTEDIAGSNGGFWTSENEIVELKDGTLRMFVRNGQGKICYADASKNAEGKYGFSMPVRTEVPSITTGNGCNISAISYSREVDGKQLLLVTTPTGGSRANGKIFAFLVDDENDNELILLDTYSIPGAEGGYCYACITELEDGRIGLLWEPNRWGEGISMFYDVFNILEIAPHANVKGTSVQVEIEKGGSYTRTYSGTGELDITETADAAIAEVTADLSVADQTKTITITGNSAGYTRALIDQTRYEITVVDELVDERIWMPIGEEGYVIENVSLISGDDTDGIVSVSEESTGIRMFDHVSNQENSMKSFSETNNPQIHISDAEFTFTQSGDYYKIYNETKKVYLQSEGAGSYFGNNAVDMKVTKVENGFRICKSNDERYLLFYYPNMDFNSNSGGYKENYAYGCQEMTLLEKTDDTSDNIIPGYKMADTVQSGKQYLICYIHEGNVIVLYPQNGTANQTRWVKDTKRVTITPERLGEINLTIEGKLYKFIATEAGCTHGDTIRRDVVEADCLTEGYTGDLYCANPDCGMLIETGEAVSAHGSHEWDEGVVTKEVTDTADGEVIYTCRRDPFHKKIEVIYASAYGPMKAEYDKAVKILEESYGMYTKETIENLETVCSTYETAAEEMKGLRSLMYCAPKTLSAAMEQLERKSADEMKEDLEKEEQAATVEFEAGGAGIPESVWQAFLTALQKEKPADDASEEEIWAWTSALESARKDLETERENLADARNKLKAAIETAGKLIAAGGSGYTAESWKVFAQAYQNAAGAPKDAEASVLKDFLEKLETAQGALKKAPAKEDDVSVGYQETINQVVYRVTDVSKRTVEVTGATASAVKIPESVLMKEKSYTVTAIADKAFKNSKTVKSVTIGSNVTILGKESFSGCKNLTKVTIGKNVTTIGAKSFFGCSKLKKVILKGTVLKQVKSQAFKKTSKKMTVKVPKKMTKKQKATLFKKMKKAGVSKSAKMK